MEDKYSRNQKKDSVFNRKGTNRNPNINLFYQKHKTKKMSCILINLVNPTPTFPSKVLYDEFHSINLNRNKNPNVDNLRKRENHWDSHFHLMWSKDNGQVTKSKRELFDSPLIYNIDGTKK